MDMKDKKNHKQKLKELGREDTGMSRQACEGIAVTQYQLRPLNLAAIETSLRHDEQIVCTNAIVVADANGNPTGWFRNDVPVCFLEEQGNET